MNIDKFQSDLAAHDSNNWLHSPGFKTDKHNLLHLVKTTGKIAAHLEAIDDEREHREAKIDPMVIADVAIEAMRFASNAGLDLSEIIGERLVQLRGRSQA